MKLNINMLFVNAFIRYYHKLNFRRISFDLKQTSRWYLYNQFSGLQEDSMYPICVFYPCHHYFDVLYYVMRYQILFITESHNLLGSSWILNRADLYMSIHVLCYMCVSLCFSFCAFFHSFVFEIGWTCVILGYANKEFEFEHLDLI